MTVYPLLVQSARLNQRRKAEREGFWSDPTAWTKSTVWTKPTACARRLRASAGYVGVNHGNMVASVHKINSEMKQGCARSIINETYPWNDFVCWIEQEHSLRSTKAVQL
jgi:hypothetical protein